MYSDRLNKYIGEDNDLDWNDIVKRARVILQEESELEEIVRLVGVDSLSESDRITMLVASMIREDYLQQNAYDDVDAYTPLSKQLKMMQIIMDFESQAREALDVGSYYDEIAKGTGEVREKIGRMKYIEADDMDSFDEIHNSLEDVMKSLVEKGGVDSNA